MELGLQIALRLLIAAYVGLGLWMTILVVQKAGFNWLWAMLPWAPSLFWVVPGLEIVGLILSPVPIVMLYLFAFLHWPALRPAGPVRKPDAAAMPQPDAVAAGGPQPRGMSVDVVTDRRPEGVTPNGSPAPRRAYSDSVEPDSWLLTGFDEDGRVVRIEIPDFELKGNPAGFLIGRNPAESDYQIRDDSVSRRHARIFAKRNTLYVEDLESANGTLVDDVELHPGQPVPLSNGGMVEFGAVKLNVSRG